MAFPKQAGERLCRMGTIKKGVDVRSLGIPVSSAIRPNQEGGTTDYAVDIYFQAKRKGSYGRCFSEGRHCIAYDVYA